MSDISDKALHEAYVRNREWPDKKCNYGYHWVKGYTRKDGTVVEGHCAAMPDRRRR